MNSRPHLRQLALPMAAMILALTAGPTHARVEIPALDPAERHPGGSTTADDFTRHAFSHPLRTTSPMRRVDFDTGHLHFKENWVMAPALADERDGLGPTFNAVSCSACHLLNGRGRPTIENTGHTHFALLFRLSIGAGPYGAPEPEPRYGDQFNPFSVLNVEREGRIETRYEEVPGQYPDGTPYSLRQPFYKFQDLGFGPMHPDTRVSPRIAQSLQGLGLLEAIAESDLIAREDAEDRDGDGISGRANRVWHVAEGRLTLGRFGWKANQPDLFQQNAAAFAGDLGVTSDLFPNEDCPSVQLSCRSSPNGGTPEISRETLDKVTLFTRLLAVPARRNFDDPEVLRGRQVFFEARCDRCHTPSFQTAVVPEWPELSNQLIWPYTDLLLHDMGEGLADHRTDFLANGREWRTPPLWGIGLIKTVNGHTDLLHDGRARNVEEAILWHDGEAAGSRRSFMSRQKHEREALVRFVNSL